MKLSSLFNPKPKEVRSAEPQRYSLTDKALADWLLKGSAGAVSESEALGIPVISAAVGMISNTVAALPFHLFVKAADGSRQKATDKDSLTKIVSNQVNTNYLTTADWLRWCVSRMLIDGRAITFIERNLAGRTTNLWPQKLDDIEVKLTNGVLTYVRKSDGARFQPGEVLDFIWKPGAEPHSHLCPITLYASSISLWLKIERYGTALFANGGVSPVIASLTSSSPEAFAKAKDELARRIKQDRIDGLPLTVIPAGVSITTLGHDPQKQQLLETKKWLVVEFARAFGNIHPAMVQDHSASTFANTEQADIAYAKHVIAPITHMIEAECNVKLFSDRNRSSFVEFNLDGLMKGDLASRYTAYSTAIQNAFMSPDEVRQRENLPAKGGNADKLLIQGATIPLDAQPESIAAE